MSDTSSFGMWLRQRRRRHDLTQSELARLAGCAVGTLRNIEIDRARPSKQLAARLARTLGVAEAELDTVVAFARGSGPAPAPRAPALTELPAAPGHAPPHSNLPAQLTRLIGRSQEIDAVRSLLLRPDVRLVTLTGPGGIGKTRVAVQVVAQLLDAFPNGIVFVDLAPITDPELLLATIAQALGVAESGGESVAARLAAALRDQTCLLLLDNFEQVVAAAPTVAKLLTACPRLKVLTTSRIALGVIGEYERAIPPLALPDRAQLPPSEQLSQYESVRLFSERAQAADPQFVITSRNAPAVAEICYQLDGLPLAIELAAARVKLFAPQALLMRLDRRLNFLTGGGRNRPTRQQTIRNTMEWSYQLLAAHEQRLFQRLGIFMGGATLEAIETICGDGDLAGVVVNAVSALVNNSLLYRLPSPPEAVDAEVDPRCGMLETIREYALEQLTVAPEAEAVRRRHAHYFAALAETAAAEWATSAINAAVARQRREHDNMRAALQWACDTGDSVLGLRLALALWGFWRSYGYISEGRTWLARLLALDGRPTDSVAMEARQRALHAAAWLASDQHDYAAAAQLFEERMALRRALGEPESETDLLINGARQARAVGQYRRAAALLEDVLARPRTLAGRTPIVGAEPALPPHEVAQALRELALVLREQGDFVRAVALLEEALALHRARGDRVGEALALLGLGDVARDQGDSVRVREYCEPSLAILRESDMQWAIGFALNSLALGAASEGDLTRASALVRQSEALFRRLQANGSLAEVLISVGQIARARGDAAAAYAALSEALSLAQAAGPRLMVVSSLEGLASLAAERGAVEQAVRLLAASASLRVDMSTPVRPADQAALGQALANARATLGETTVAAMWQVAQALPLGQLLSALFSTAAFVALREQSAR